MGESSVEIFTFGLSRFFRGENPSTGVNLDLNPTSMEPSSDTLAGRSRQLFTFGLRGSFLHWRAAVAKREPPNDRTAIGRPPAQRETPFYEDAGSELQTLKILVGPC
ncbi:hypothetical protein NDU88_005490 [Pleurodeles waltl]|uniref:Uncharacterized protein n=1 Tax=Pleurodeles waltl TaxID=8319 RepID=A0AAV7SM11_PLEWA|nr:hypothetical protein NDU88_005490 [Pleurodeles waltl]